MKSNSTDISSDRTTRNRWIGLVFGITVLGAWLRCYRIGWHSLWLDEAYSILLSRKSVVSIIAGQLRDSSPPLFYVLLHAWQSLFGGSEAAVRSMSAAAGILVIPLAAGVGLKAAGKWTGILAALLAALSPLQIYYSQEARMYITGSLLGLSAASLWLLPDLPRRSRYAGAVITALAIYTHNYGWLLWGSFIVFTLVYDRSRKALVQHLITALLSAPWFAAILVQIHRDTTPWIPPPALHDLGKTLHCYLAGFPRFNAAWDLGMAGLAFLLTAVALMLTARPVRRLAVFGWILPLAAAWTLSWMKPMYVAGRYDLMFHGTALVVMAAAVHRIWSRSRLPGLAVLLAVLIPAAFAVWHYYYRFVKSNDRTVAAYIRSLPLTSADMLVTTDLSVNMLKYYAPDLPAPVVPFPGGEPGWLPRRFLDNDPAFVRTALSSLEMVLHARPPDRLVLLLCAPELAAHRELLEFMDARFRVADRYHFSPPMPYNQVDQVLIYRPKWDAPGQTGTAPHRNTADEELPDNGM